jgi:membrane-associated protease RseP (regulator of RpoE activity)
MSTDVIALLSLLAIIGILVLWQRKRVKTFSFLKVFYFCMIRTKLGMRLMNRIARIGEPLLRKAGYVMIPAGFLGMFVMIEELVRGIILVLQNNDAITVGVVLPIHAKGVFYVPFVYWIIAIVFIMVVHEFAHGLIARAHRVRVKSTGFAFLGALIPVVPGAFVEIDEKHLARQNTYTQLNIFSAGPFINIVFGLVFWVLLVGLQPINDAVLVGEGMRVLSVAENSPAAITGLAVGDVLTGIDRVGVGTAEQFRQAFEGKKAGDTVIISTQEGEKTIVLAGDDTAFLGVKVEEARTFSEQAIAEYGSFLPAVFVWFFGLVEWLFILNLGVGLFNLVPLGPIDGGRMFHTILQRVLPHGHARRVWHSVSAMVLVMVVGTIVSAFI